MKRSVSRASRAYIEAQDSLEGSIPGLSDINWQDYLEKEENDFFILKIREEIINNCLDICYENYLSRQAVAFTVHCAYLAWHKVIDMYYMFRDPGDTDDPEVKASWEPDDEPEPSIIDSWGSEAMKLIDPNASKKKEPEQEPSIKPTPMAGKNDVESIETSSFMSHLFDAGEGEYEYSYAKAFSESDTYCLKHKKSIFTRTLSMSRESLPLLQPLMFFEKGCKMYVPSAKKKNVVEKTATSSKVPE